MLMYLCVIGSSLYGANCTFSVSSFPLYSHFLKMMLEIFAFIIEDMCIESVLNVKMISFVYYFKYGDPFTTPPP